MGNKIKSDDGAGSVLAEKLKLKLKIDVIDVETSLENYLGTIVKLKPGTVILIDAVYLKKKPGTIKIITENNFSIVNFSTHGLSLDFFLNYLKEHKIENFIIIGIQPKKVDYGTVISLPVINAMNTIEKTLVKLFSR